MAYFEQKLVERPEIQRIWCGGVLTSPLKTVTQPNGRISYWSVIPECGDPVLLSHSNIESEEIALDVVIDFDAAGGVVGLEIDLASSKVDLKNLDLKGLLIPERLTKLM